MKNKLIAMLIIASVSVGMTACGSSSTTDSKESTESSQESEKTSSDGADDSTDETSDEEKPDDELSQAEWMEKYGNDLVEDGYDKVDTIDITTDKTSCKYTGSKVVDGSEGGKILLVYFDFTNINDSNIIFPDHYIYTTYQNGIQLDRIDWDVSIDEDESFNNYYKEILSGATINVAVAYDLQDDTSPVKLRVDNRNEDNGVDTALYFQQQEIQIQ